VLDPRPTGSGMDSEVEVLSKATSSLVVSGRLILLCSGIYGDIAREL